MNEAREVGAEGEDEERHDDPRHEEQHLAQQVRDVGEAEAVEADDERGEDHQPVGERGEDPGGVGLDAALLEEAVHAGALGEHVEVHRAQPFLRRQAHALGEQPAADQHQRRERETRQEFADLMEQRAQRFDQQVEIFHGDLLHPSRVARMPCSGMPAQAGRFCSS